MRIEAKQLLKIVIGLVFLGLVFWLVAYYSSRNQSPAPTPAPDQSAARYGEADRLKLLQSLKSSGTTAKPVTPAERDRVLKALRSSAVVQTTSVAERQRVLDSLKTK